MDLGVKANILKNIDQNTVDRSTYGRYLTEDFIDLVIKPSFLEIGNKLKELENNIRTQKATLETKTETLNNALFSVSIIVPGGLVILIVTSCILERKTRKLAAKIKYTYDTPGEILMSGYGGDDPDAEDNIGSVIDVASCTFAVISEDPLVAGFQIFVDEMRIRDLTEAEDVIAFLSTYFF